MNRAHLRKRKQQVPLFIAQVKKGGEEGCHGWRGDWAAQYPPEETHGGSFTALIAIDGKIPLASVSEHNSHDRPRSAAHRGAASSSPNSGSCPAASTLVGAAPPFRKEIAVHASSHIDFHSFTVEIEFSSGGELYATETYKVEAADWHRAQRDALEMSVSSPYDNVRIPDLARRVITR